jgi:hypothetical protein
VGFEVGWRRGYGRDEETAAAAAVAAAMVVEVMVPAGEEGWDVCRRPWLVGRMGLRFLYSPSWPFSSPHPQDRRET